MCLTAAARASVCLHVCAHTCVHVQVRGTHTCFSCECVRACARVVWQARRRPWCRRCLRWARKTRTTPTSGPHPRLPVRRRRHGRHALSEHATALPHATCTVHCRSMQQPTAGQPTVPTGRPAANREHRRRTTRFIGPKPPQRVTGDRHAVSAVAMLTSPQVRMAYCSGNDGSLRMDHCPVVRAATAGTCTGGCCRPTPRPLRPLSSPNARPSPTTRAR